MPEEPESGTATEAQDQAATAVADANEAGADKPKKLGQQVTMSEAGPCRKHVKVVIPRGDIEERINEKFSGMMTEAVVPGYRPGKAPRKLIERRFYKDVTEQLKGELLLQSLEQLAEDHKLNPIAQPNIDPFKIEIPKDGDLEYEFDVEVAPDFELPSYKGLRLKRPVRDIAETDVAKAQKNLLRNYGTMQVKEGPAQAEDIVLCDVDITIDGQPLRKFENITARLDPQLAFQDGMVEDFGEKMAGVKADETRQLTIHLSPNVPNESLRGRNVQGAFHVKEVRFIKLPELNEEFFASVGVHNEEQLKERVKALLNSQLEYEQRQAARAQVLDMIAAAANWELPADLVERQTRKTLQRRIMELRSAGYGDDVIRSRANLLRQDATANTIKALKEHFVLQKIAEVENLDVSDEDVEFEVENIADQTGESPRKVRARLEREDLLDALMNQIIERKSLDLVLESATYDDVPFEPEKQMAAVEEQMVPAEEKPPAAPEA